MMFNKKISAFGLTSAILFSATAAMAEGESVETQQKTLLQKLDSLNAAVLGLRINGTAKAGALASMAGSDQFSADSPTQENQAFTDVNLAFTARPSSETQVRLEMRLHKDWQSGFDENNNPMIGHWFSYDGKILDKHVDFNLGYMKVAYTPYTLYTPQQQLLQEPEIFAQKRVEAMAQRNLDTTTARLMQGLNVDYHSGNIGPLSDIHAQATGARMRNTAKKYDQVFFDFDYADRYFYGLRAGAELFGANLGVNYTDVFDRHKGARARMTLSDVVHYEDNSILSVELGFNSKEILPTLPVEFGLNGEYAMSWFSADKDYKTKVADYTYDLQYTNVYGDSIIIVVPYIDSVAKIVNEKEGEANGSAFYIEPYVNLDMAGIQVEAKVMYLKNDENFWSEMASSPVYEGNGVVLNANAMYSTDAYTNLVNKFGMSSLENMYFAVYNSNPLNLTNLMTSETSKNALTNTKEDGKYFNTRQFNNYKNAHFYRNGYNAEVMKRREISEALVNMDPSVSMELPYGVATPDRQGLKAALNFHWNDAVEVNAVFAKLDESAATKHDADGKIVDGETEANSFMRYGVGLGLDIGRFIPDMGLGVKLQLSYDHAEEDAYLERSMNRLMGGLSVGLFNKVDVLVGYQTSSKTFGKPLVVGTNAITKTEESLLLAGPRVKIAPNSFVTVQYGRLTDEVILKDNNELSIDKDVLIADVTVNF